MKTRFLRHVVPVAMIGLVIVLGSGCSTPSTRARFATPDEAAVALQQALKADNLEKMQAIFGRADMQAVASGDPVSDRLDREVITTAMAQSWHWEPRGDGAQELVIGDEQWPYPFPLVKVGNEWQFDSDAGKEELLARRIGRNELGVISLCHDYVRAQKQYASQPHDGKPAGLFAQRFRSTPGLHDGLFWQVKRGEKFSPFGRLVAAAIAGGYDPNKLNATPFLGYRFRILTAQGPAAPGGQKSYVVNGDMIAGFALLAYPAKYALSGVMTFMVSQDGVVFQKDLGPDTGTEAPRIVAFNPDKSWTAVPSPD